jgi:transcriptional regulator with XRE-family HTH domain
MAGEFGAYLRRHLTSSGLRTQLAVSRELGMDYAQLNKIVTGKTKRPAIETLERIAPAIKRPLGEVLLAAGYHAPQAAPSRAFATHQATGAGGPSDALAEERMGEYLDLARLYLASVPPAELASVAAGALMPDLTDPAEVARIIAYHESDPSEAFRQQLAREKHRREKVSYVDFCVRLYRTQKENAHWGFSAGGMGSDPA